VRDRLVKGVKERAPAVFSRRTFLIFVLPAFGVFYLVAAVRIDSPPAELQVSARAFPMIIGAALIVSALVIVWQELRAPKAEDAAALEDDEGEGEAAIESWRDFWLAFAALVLMVVLLDDLGFVISATALVAGLAVYLDRPHAARNIVAALVYVLVLYYLFDSVFEIILPSGPLPW